MGLKALCASESSDLMLFQPLQSTEAVELQLGMCFLSALLLVLTIFQTFRKRIKPVIACLLLVAAGLVLADWLAFDQGPMMWVMGIAVISLMLPIRRGELPRPVRGLAVSLVVTFAVAVILSGSRWATAAKPLTGEEAKALTFERLRAYCEEQHNQASDFRIVELTPGDESSYLVAFRNRTASSSEVFVTVTRYRTTELSF